MKILLVHKYFYHRGGVENSLFQTMELLKKKGHNVSVFFDAPSAESGFGV